MDRDVFLAHLNDASGVCHEFTTRYVSDELPETFAFWVRLNQSYDENLTEGEVVFPDDVKIHGKRAGPLTADAVVSLLWRDGMVPEWIDISVWETDATTTYFKLTCCGRFTADFERLYYNWTDCPPFGIKGPVFPRGIASEFVDGHPARKFTLAESRLEWARGRDTEE